MKKIVEPSGRTTYEGTPEEIAAYEAWKLTPSWQFVWTPPTWQYVRSGPSTIIQNCDSTAPKTFPNG